MVKNGSLGAVSWGSLLSAGFVVIKLSADEIIEFFFALYLCILVSCFYGEIKY